MSEPLRLYALHDDALGQVEPDERWWCLLWAPNARDAQLVAASHYTGDGPTQEMGWQTMLDVEEVALPAALYTEYAPAWPGIETDPVVLRLAGWMRGDEEQCSACGHHTECPSLEQEV